MILFVVFSRYEGTYEYMYDSISSQTKEIDLKKFKNLNTVTVPVKFEKLRTILFYNTEDLITWPLTYICSFSSETSLSM